ncbi:hypothetical protein C8J56DRAFT_381243 [Mycena floridula]|nr:hypothetical protein C8J56DRAFT_381243 [Mycena floridula]
MMNRSRAERLDREKKRKLDEVDGTSPLRETSSLKGSPREGDRTRSRSKKKVSATGKDKTNAKKISEAPPKEKVVKTNERPMKRQRTGLKSRKSLETDTPELGFRRVLHCLEAAKTLAEVKEMLDELEKGIKGLVNNVLSIPSVVFKLSRLVLYRFYAEAQYDPSIIGKTAKVSGGALEEVLALFVEQATFITIPVDLTAFKAIIESDLTPESLAVLACNASEVIIPEMALERTPSEFQLEMATTFLKYAEKAYIDHLRGDNDSDPVAHLGTSQWIKKYHGDYRTELIKVATLMAKHRGHWYDDEEEVLDAEDALSLSQLPTKVALLLTNDIFDTNKVLAVPYLPLGGPTLVKDITAMLITYQNGLTFTFTRLFACTATTADKLEPDNSLVHVGYRTIVRGRDQFNHDGTRNMYWDPDEMQRKPDPRLKGAFLGVLQLFMTHHVTAFAGIALELDEFLSSQTKMETLSTLDETEDAAFDLIISWTLAAREAAPHRTATQIRHWDLSGGPPKFVCDKFPYPMVLDLLDRINTDWFHSTTSKYSSPRSYYSRALNEVRKLPEHKKLLNENLGLRVFIRLGHEEIARVDPWWTDWTGYSFAENPKESMPALTPEYIQVSKALQDRFRRSQEMFKKLNMIGSTIATHCGIPLDGIEQHTRRPIVKPRSGKSKAALEEQFQYKMATGRALSRDTYDSLMQTLTQATWDFYRISTIDVGLRENDEHWKPQAFMESSKFDIVPIDQDTENRFFGDLAHVSFAKIMGLRERQKHEEEPVDQDMVEQDDQQSQMDEQDEQMGSEEEEVENNYPVKGSQEGSEIGSDEIQPVAADDSDEEEIVARSLLPPSEADSTIPAIQSVISSRITATPIPSSILPPLKTLCGEDWTLGDYNIQPGHIISTHRPAPKIDDPLYLPNIAKKKQQELDVQKQVVDKPRSRRKREVEHMCRSDWDLLSLGI